MNLIIISRAKLHFAKRFSEKCFDALKCFADRAKEVSVSLPRALEYRFSSWVGTDKSLIAWKLFESMKDDSYRKDVFDCINNGLSTFSKEDSILAQFSLLRQDHLARLYDTRAN